MKRSIAVLSVGALIAGCAWQWPKEGSGGTAERGSFSTPYEMHLARSNAPVSRTAETDLWRTRLMVNKQRADLLRTEGAVTYYPAMVDDITSQYQRASRELEGGLPADAINNTLKLEAMIDALERRMIALGKHGNELIREHPPALQRTPAATPSELEEALLAQGVTIRRGEKGIVQLGIDTRTLFDTNSAALKPFAMSTLTNVAQALQRYQSVVMGIVGHTDASGSDNHNKGLSLARAEAVKKYLITQGVNGQHIHLTGSGETQPIANNQTVEGRFTNRRVDIWLAPLVITQEHETNKQSLTH